MGKKAVRSSTTVIVKALRNGGLGKTYELPFPCTVGDLKVKMQADPHTYDIVDGVGKAASEYQIYQKPAKDAPQDAPKVCSNIRRRLNKDDITWVDKNARN